MRDKDDSLTGAHVAAGIGGFVGEGVGPVSNMAGPIRCF